jgi:hypothetical protein
MKTHPKKATIPKTTLTEHFKKKKEIMESALPISEKHKRLRDLALSR